MPAVKAIVAEVPTTPLVRNWSLQEVDISSPGDDEVLVELYATGICSTDILLGSLPKGSMSVEYPKIVGHEGAGIVREIGKNVRSVALGDPVVLSFSSCTLCAQCEDSHPAYCDDFRPRNYRGKQESTKIISSGKKVWTEFFGQSSFAQFSVVNKTSVVNVKDLIQDLSELKLFAPLGCGFQTGMGAIQNVAQAGPKDVVLISGMGAVGMGALMTAVIEQCKTIIAVDRVKSRLDSAKKFGATHTINTSNPSFINLNEAVRALVPGGASIAIDATGVPEIIEQSMEATQKRGKIILIGVPPLDYFMNIQGAALLNAIPQIIKWYREGKFPIDQCVQAFGAMEYEKALVSFKKGEVIKPVLVWKD
ncbi:Alcohol dehydrogenase superfamily zinc-type [Penicillium angulare]|uniref:Alcohol dehydrogenase superfamily zinc-type n=1 Tax=Penicillium angulare TaxID=116970 RepID=UPI0025401851|nr:Alcohol dehydrogenase superfamily zinc-type [Penicillium angulare]KAJ5263365.1 Alcohol dehydrogenase superfamily zinc-type [Penicillium angulare]